MFWTYNSIFSLVNESPRWLIVKGKSEEANDVIQFIAECNKREIPEKLDFEAAQEDLEKVTSFV